MKPNIEEILEKYLPSEDTFAKELLESMNYSVLIGGKRIRPTMMYETFKLFGGEGDAIEPFMAAIEMIHTYSLVHDDLPAMDGDELRRGKETTWKKYGEAGGVLAGDALLTYAFEVASQATNCKPELLLKAIHILARKAGLYGMCGGQAVDVALTGKTISPEEMDFIFENKTSALIEASIMIGAILAGADDEEVKTCEKIGSDIGIAFQIRDDILDVIADEAVLGKNVGSDMDNNKTTYVTLYGLEKAQEDVVMLSERAIKLLETLPGDKTYFINFIKSLEERNK